MRATNGGTRSSGRNEGLLARKCGRRHGPPTWRPAPRGGPVRGSKPAAQLWAIASPDTTRMAEADREPDLALAEETSFEDSRVRNPRSHAPEARNRAVCRGHRRRVEASVAGVSGHGQGRERRSWGILVRRRNAFNSRSPKDAIHRVSRREPKRAGGRHGNDNGITTTTQARPNDTATDARTSSASVPRQFYSSSQRQRRGRRLTTLHETDKRHDKEPYGLGDILR